MQRSVSTPTMRCRPLWFRSRSLNAASPSRNFPVVDGYHLLSRFHWGNGKGTVLRAAQLSCRSAAAYQPAGVLKFHFLSVQLIVRLSMIALFVSGVLSIPWYLRTNRLQCASPALVSFLSMSTQILNACILLDAVCTLINVPCVRSAVWMFRNADMWLSRQGKVGDGPTRHTIRLSLRFPTTDPRIRYLPLVRIYACFSCTFCILSCDIYM